MAQQHVLGEQALARRWRIFDIRRSLGIVGNMAREHPLGFAGFVVVLLMVIVAIFAPGIAPHSPYATDVPHRLSGPSAGHLLGTDQIGRDVLSRVIYGARISILVGLLSVSLGAVVGTTFGITAGYRGRYFEMLIMRGIDVLMAFPTILLAIVIVAFFGSSLLNVIVAIAITRIPTFTRITHAMTLSIKETELVEAARSIGANHLRVGFRHILPNALAPVVVIASLEVSVAILIEASLGFLGLSVQAPTATWGSIIQDGRGVLDRAPWIANSAGAFIFLLVIAINLMGDGLRDFLDPRAESARRSAGAGGNV